MGDLIFAFFNDDFYQKAINIVKAERTPVQGVFTLKATLKELGYSESFTQAVIKRLKKRGAIP